MKKLLLLGAKLLILPLLLAACSTKAPSTSPSSSTTEEVTQQQFEAGNGAFSISLKGDWEAVDYLPGFDLELSSPDDSREIQINQYAKKDIFLTVAEFAEKTQDIAIIEQRAKMDGRQMFMQLAPIPDKK